jgi:hypothetical protein
VLLLRATLEQYLHEFDAAVAHLRLLLARPGSERQSQAWLTLATVLRVQGRYAESDAACGNVGGAEIYRARAWPRTRRCAARPRRRGAASRRFWRRAACRGNARLADDVAGRARGARRRAAAADAAVSQRPQARARHLRGDRVCRLPDKGLAKAAGADTEPSPKTGFVHRRNSVAARDPRPFLDAAGRRGTRRRIGMAERPRWRGSRRSRCRSSSAASRASVRERSRPEMSGLNRVLLSTSGSSARSSNRS